VFGMRHILGFGGTPRDRDTVGNIWSAQPVREYVSSAGDDGEESACRRQFIWRE